MQHAHVVSDVLFLMAAMKAVTVFEIVCMCDAHDREELMEEVSLLHEKFENQGTRRTYRSASQAYDVRTM